jgi:hypothetical protein
MVPFGMACQDPKEIDTEVDAAPSASIGAKGAESMKAAKAVLVITSGHQRGHRGRIRRRGAGVGGKTVDYYKLETGSSVFRRYKTATWSWCSYRRGVGEIYAYEGWSVGASGITVGTKV